ncbi:hypothetical protein BDEG_26619 [Batrachochytrium dendrobatidis JEL423]|uniref:Meiosis-specific nuclear structural protein 1 n=1 Tax=Batrachochytrium dendrobatidis (strain JEL423) TaxID=403673 RepID=A0A177WTV1_BATDL|nr:hypothetical protein BDEG_26619 [Batrachochytrium dendrobatidis JEL423]
MQERRERESRRQQNMREDMVKHLQRDTLIKTTLSSDNRVEQVRLHRAQKLQEQEQETYNYLMEDDQRQKDIKDNFKLEEELLEEMGRIQHERRGMRELEKKLTMLYEQRAAHFSYKKKQLISKQSKIQEDTVIAEMNAHSYKEYAKEVDKQRKAQERNIEYHQALNNQLAEAEVKKQQEYEQFLKEKAVVDEIVKRILEENERESNLRLEKQNETKQFIEAFMKEREHWRQMEQERQNLENQRIQEYAHLQYQREALLENKRQTVAAGKNAIYDKLAAEIQFKEKEKLELEELRIDLAQEEQEAVARKRDQDTLEQRIRKRLELIDAYQMQMQDKRRRMEEERVDEEQFRHKMMLKFAEDDKLDQINQQKRRMKQIEHKRAVDALVEDRHRRAQEDIENQRIVAQKEIEIEKYRQTVIEQERQRLLLEHASKLVGFLPKGVLRDEKDLGLFDEEFRKRFEKLST